MSAEIPEEKRRILDGKKLRTIRKSRKDEYGQLLIQTKLAQKLNNMGVQISQQAISDYERGEREQIHIDDLKKLAQVLELSSYKDLMPNRPPALGSNRAVLTQPQELRIGSISTTFVVVDGDGEAEYQKENLRCHYSRQPLKVPSDIKSLRVEIERKQVKAKKEGREHHWNGPMYGLERFVRSRTIYEEDLELDIYFRPTDYFLFLATSMSLERQVEDGRGGRVTLRDKYLYGGERDRVVPFLATSFGIMLAIITSDRYLIVTQRSGDVGSWTGCFSASANEGLSRVLDRDESGRPDPYRAGARGAREELSTEIEPADIRFLSFGFDSERYQWGLLGMTKADLSLSEIQDRVSLGARDRWENREIRFVPFDPPSVAAFVMENSPWQPGGLTCIIHTLIHEFGRDQVERALSLVKR